jgi:hypothetical protein
MHETDPRRAIDEGVYANEEYLTAKTEIDEVKQELGRKAAVTQTINGATVDLNSGATGDNTELFLTIDNDAIVADNDNE